MSSTNQERTATGRVISWTQFRVPTSEPIFEIDNSYPPSDARQKWVDTISPLSEAADLEGACWMRYKNAPETVALCAQWDSRQALKVFRASPGHARYWAGISAFSEPEEMVMDGINDDITFSLPRAPWVSVMRLTFAHPTDDALRREVGQLSGLLSPQNVDVLFSARARWRPALRSVSRPLWALHLQVNPDGVAVETVFVFHYWESAEEAEKYKQNERCNYYLQQDVGRLPPMEGFARKVRQLGALECTEEYPQPIVRIYNRFNGEPNTIPITRNGRKIFPRIW